MSTTTMIPAVASRAAVIDNAIRANRKDALLVVARDFGIRVAKSWSKVRIIGALRGETWVAPVTRRDGAPTVAALKAECKARGLKGASGMNRAMVETYLATGVRPAPVLVRRDGTPNAAGLKAECKARGLKGASGLTRAQLESYLATGVRPKRTIATGTVAWLRDTMKGLGLAGRSKLDRAGMIRAIINAGYGDDLVNVIDECNERNRQTFVDALRAAGLPA